MKKKSSMKKFKTTAEMDRYLVSNDLGEQLRTHGVLHKPDIKKINLDLPGWIVQQVDRIAEKLGVSRQPLLKIWIHERLKMESAK